MFLTLLVVSLLFFLFFCIHILYSTIILLVIIIDRIRYIVYSLCMAGLVGTGYKKRESENHVHW